MQLLNYIYSYLIITTKRKKAELILSTYKSITPKNGYYTQKILIQKRNFIINFRNKEKLHDISIVEFFRV